MGLTQVNSGGINDNTIVDADLNSSANIASTKLAKPIDLADNEKVRFGTGNDLEIYHDGTRSRIHDGATNATFFTTPSLHIRNQADNENVAKFNVDGAVELYHDNSQKFVTKSDGVDVIGELQCDTLDVDGNGDVAGTLTVNQLVVDDDGSNSPSVAIRADDGSPWALQVSNDTWSSGSNRGLLFHQNNDGRCYTRVQGVNNTWEDYVIDQNNGSTTNTAIYLTLNREVQLNYQGSTKLTTKSDGVDITGELQCDSLDVDGSSSFESVATFGGSYTSFNDNGYIRGDVSGIFQLQAGSSNTFRFVNSGNSVTFAEITSGSFRPGATNTYDIGTTSQKWRAGYFDNNVYANYYEANNSFRAKDDNGGIYFGDTGGGFGSACAIARALQNGYHATYSQAGDFVIGAEYQKSILFGTTTSTSGAITGRCRVNSNGHFEPTSNNSYDLGTSSNRWRNVYTNDLNLSNEGSANDVDGTWGNYTIQEGEDDLFLINRRNGKKYKFNLTEVN